MAEQKVDVYVKYLIIGGGISGLTFANYVQKDFCLVEKEDEVGGYCRTIRDKGFIWDYAGHFFHFNTEEFKQRFIDSIDPREIIYKQKNTKILYKQSLINYPFQTNIHQLDKQEFIECLYDLFNKQEKNEYDNFLDMLYGKFGKSIVEKFLKPYNEKLYAVDLQELDKDAMGRFFPYASISSIINNMKENQDNVSYNNTFLYPRQGAGAFIQLLVDTLDMNNIKLNSEVVKIDKDNKIAELSDGTIVNYKYLINTSPLNSFLKIFKSRPFGEIEDILSYNKVLVFNLGFNKKSKYTSEHWFYIPDKEINFYRIGFYDNILDTDKLSMYVEIGYSKDSEIDLQYQLDETLKNLRLIGILEPDMQLIAHTSIVMDPAYVHISTQSEEAVKKFKETVEKNQIYTIGRYGGWKYCSMEDCMMEAKKIAEKICCNKINPVI